MMLLAAAYEPLLRTLPSLQFQSSGHSQRTSQCALPPSLAETYGHTSVFSREKTNMCRSSMARAEGGFCPLYSSNIRLVAMVEPMCVARIVFYEICLHRSLTIGTFSSSTTESIERSLVGLIRLPAVFDLYYFRTRKHGRNGSRLLGT